MSTCAVDLLYQAQGTQRMKMALGSTKLESWQSKVGRLPKTVRLNVAHGEDSELFEGLHELHANDGRVVLLHALGMVTLRMEVKL